MCLGGENLGSLRLNRTFMTRSIQLRDIKRTVGVTPWTKERLSQESLNSRTREYILVRQMGQLFFKRVDLITGLPGDGRKVTRFPG